jgi:hypothetical protein
MRTPGMQRENNMYRTRRHVPSLRLYLYESPFLSLCHNARLREITFSRATSAETQADPNLGMPDLILFGLGGPALGPDVTFGKLVEGLFLSVQLSEGEEEGDTTERGQDGTGHVVPDEVGVVTERDEGLSDSSGYGVGQERQGLDDGPHVTGSLGVGVFEDGDRGEDLGETDQSVSTDLRPDVDGGRDGLKVKQSGTVSKEDLSISPNRRSLTMPSSVAQVLAEYPQGLIR